MTIIESGIRTALDVIGQRFEDEKIIFPGPKAPQSCNAAAASQGGPRKAESKA